MTEAQRITAALRGHWHGRYGTALCPAHQNTRTPALSLTDGEDGRLLMRCHAGCSFQSILDALRGLGLVEGTGRLPQTDPAELARHRAKRRRDAEKRERQALAVWRKAQPIHGSPAERYLRGRGITCALPDSLRFHSAAWHGPSAHSLPAMVAMVEGAEGFAVHRTFLRPDGMGKAEVEPGTAKMMLGATTGGAVRLIEAEGPLVVAEGIETALSLASGLLRGPASIWAALSASGMTGLHLPAQTGRLIVATDGDEAGRSAGFRLADRAAGLGWDVSTLPAPDRRDWNDVLMMKGAAA